MNWRMTKALIAKDLTLYFRNRFFALVSVLGVLAWAGIYLVMPKNVDELLEIGLYAPAVPPALAGQMAEGGMVLRQMDSEAALKSAMADGEFSVGVVLPADLMEKIAMGQKAQATVYFTSDFPEELRGAYTILLQELGFLLAGQSLSIEATEQILGIDMAGRQIAPRDRMLPVFAILVLMVETMGVASLISTELEAGTLEALLTTPLTVEGLFLGKGLMGVGMAFVQVTALMALTGGLSQHPVLILVALLLGSLLVTGIGFLMASAARDLMGVMSWGILAVLLLSVPGFSVMFPGTISDWVKAIPSYYLVDTVHRAANYGLGWADAWLNLVILLGFAIFFFGLGIAALRRKLR